MPASSATERAAGRSRGRHHGHSGRPAAELSAARRNVRGRILPGTPSAFTAGYAVTAPFAAALYYRLNVIYIDLTDGAALSTEKS